MQKSLNITGVILLNNCLLRRSWAKNVQTGHNSNFSGDIIVWIGKPNHCDERTSFPNNECHENRKSIHFQIS